jgi:hypothetical protein
MSPPQSRLPQRAREQTREKDARFSGRFNGLSDCRSGVPVKPSV